MASSDVCPTEDAIKAFLEYLVDPMLPAKPGKRDKLSLSQRESVAKQVHSVVLLYNYYHRKQYPELAFLSFHEFCKLAVVLKPTLSAHMTSTQKTEETELVDVEKHLSLTEEKILNACNICTCLDASKNVPAIEGWPISKVAVLLIDSKKENCFLLFSSITEGVWSVIEKDVNTFSQISEVTSGASGAKFTYKKKRVIKKPTKFELNSEEDGLLKIGYSAVKEATGINKTDITSLESYTVYSQSKAKTASRFYIMKCSHLINQKFIQVPIKYLIASLQGPLVKRSSSSSTVTSVVEYFHVLPYSEMISEWISRETFSSSLQVSKPAAKNMMVGSTEVTEPYISSQSMSIDLNINSSSVGIEALNQNKNNGSCAVTLSASIKEAQDVYVDNTVAFPSKNKECQLIANTLQVRGDQEIENPSVQHYSNRSKNPTKAENGDSMRMLVNDGNFKDQSTCDKICAKTSSENDPIEECALIANNPNSDHEKLQVVIASNEKTLSQTAITSFKNDSIEEGAFIANNPNSDDEKLQILVASKGKTLSQTAKTSFKNDSIAEHALIANNSNSDIEKLQIVIASNEKTLSQTAVTSFKNDSIEERALIANNPNSDLEKPQIVIASKEKTLSQTAVTSFKNDSTEERALIANNPNSDLEKPQIVIASKEKTLSQTAVTSFKNDSTEERALIANNPNSDLEKPQIVIASKEKTLSQTAITSFKNDSIEERALIANNPNSDIEKLQIVVASKEKALSQTAKTSFKNDSVEERASIVNNPNSDLEKLQILIASKRRTLSETALNNLMRKRNALALQQRMIEDEMALCDKKIHRILTSGEDDLELKLESIIEGSNDSWVRNQGRTGQHLDDQPLPPCSKRRRLTEAVFTMKSPCQELDDICHENNWVLPSYHVSETNGGMQATVVVKGLDFQRTGGGEMCSHPRDARESAAAEMLANLRRMAKSDQ